MTAISMRSNAAQVAELLYRAQLAVDPAIQKSMIPLGQELMTTEKELAPKGRNHQGRGKTLSDSIYLKVGRLGLQVKTNKRYAKIQNDGGTTKPHEILPKRKDALAFNGIVTKSVHHPGSHIRGQHFAERALETMEERIVEGLEAAAVESIARSLA